MYLCTLTSKRIVEIPPGASPEEFSRIVYLFSVEEQFEILCALQAKVQVANRKMKERREVSCKDLDYT